MAFWSLRPSKEVIPTTGEASAKSPGRRGGGEQVITSTALLGLLAYPYGYETI